MEKMVRENPRLQAQEGEKGNTALAPHQDRVMHRLPEAIM